MMIVFRQSYTPELLTEEKCFKIFISEKVVGKDSMDVDSLREEILQLEVQVTPKFLTMHRRESHIE